MCPRRCHVKRSRVVCSPPLSSMHFVEIANSLWIQFPAVNRRLARVHCQRGAAYECAAIRCLVLLYVSRLRVLFAFCYRLTRNLVSMVLSYLSDRYDKRSLTIMFCSVLTTVGFIMFLGPSLRFFSSLVYCLSSTTYTNHSLPVRTHPLRRPLFHRPGNLQHRSATRDPPRHALALFPCLLSPIPVHVRHLHGPRDRDRDAHHRDERGRSASDVGPRRLWRGCVQDCCVVLFGVWYWRGGGRGGVRWPYEDEKEQWAGVRCGSSSGFKQLCRPHLTHDRRIVSISTPPRR